MFLIVSTINHCKEKIIKHPSIISVFEGNLITPSKIWIIWKGPMLLTVMCGSAFWIGKRCLSRLCLYYKTKLRNGWLLYFKMHPWSKDENLKILIVAFLQDYNYERCKQVFRNRLSKFYPKHTDITGISLSYVVALKILHLLWSFQSELSVCQKHQSWQEYEDRRGYHCRREPKNTAAGRKERMRWHDMAAYLRLFFFKHKNRFM